MVPLDVKNLRYQDQLGRKRRRFFVFKILTGLTVVAAVLAGIGYVVFFSPLLKVHNITLNGLETIESGPIRETINQALARYHNLLLLSGASLAKQFTEQYPNLKTVTTHKNFPHDVEFNFTERKPRGVWCFPDGCRYFDTEGIFWGQAFASTGSLLLTIQDTRQDVSSASTGEFLTDILQAVGGLEEIGLRSGQIQITSVARDFQIPTDKGMLTFGLDSNILNQVRNLKTFFDQKNPGPLQSIDLRIDGRIYYK